MIELFEEGVEVRACGVLYELVRGSACDRALVFFYFGLTLVLQEVLDPDRFLIVPDLTLDQILPFGVHYKLFLQHYWTLRAFRFSNNQIVVASLLEV